MLAIGFKTYYALIDCNMHLHPYPHGIRTFQAIII